MNYCVKCLSKALLLAIFSLSLTGCGHDADKKKPTTAPTLPNQAVNSPPRQPAEILPVNGKVLEIVDTGSFLFLAMDWQGKKVWVTVPGVELKVGEVISLDHANMIKKFHSKTLNRTFDELIFASGVVGKSPRPRMVNNANVQDPRNRRSGKLMAGQGAPMAPTAAVPAKPLANPVSKADH